jgi:hypothetical protein
MLYEIQYFNVAFNSLSFRHVFRERNMEANGLSKDGLQLASSSWHAHEFMAALCCCSIFFYDF